MALLLLMWLSSMVGQVQVVKWHRFQCPVIALHGDYDPHPMAGVREPLCAKLATFRFIEIEHCGHKPWLERQAKDIFYKILKDELLLA